MEMADKFNFEQAFSRNLGWVTEDELNILRRKRIAIAGMGGVGGNHLITHVRLGCEQFHIADFDTFELVNFNRQSGASMSHLGQPKVDVMEALALDINPHLKIVKFPQGIYEDIFDDFFKNCDLFIDGLDFFAITIRSKAFQYCYDHNIPAVTVAPLGLGASMLSFLPNQLSFEQYFRLNNQSPQEQMLRFLTGLAPSALHHKALVDPSRVQLEAKKAPSLTIGCELSAALCASQAFKILLNRGLVITAPKSLHFDAYTYQMKVSWRPLGACNPLQIWQRFWVRRAFTTSKE